MPTRASSPVLPRLPSRPFWVRKWCSAPTGYEAYWIVRAEARSVKRQMCGIEDFHPLGRLFDLDVIQSDATPLSRTDVGFAPRRCLLCDQEARWCMRNHTHTQEEILQRIDEMVREFNAEN